MLSLAVWAAPAGRFVTVGGGILELGKFGFGALRPLGRLANSLCLIVEKGRFIQDDFTFVGAGGHVFLTLRWSLLRSFFANHRTLDGRAVLPAAY